MRALVTGARGFLGQHLVERLAGCEVSQFQGDIRDAKAFEDILRHDVVYHLAAVSNVPASVADPTRTWSVNADGTMRLLEWARKVDIGRVVLVSTAHVYGRAQYSPIDEKHPTDPVSPYGASKLAAEAMARAYHSTYGLEVVVVRPFNIYGPGQGAGFLIPDILLPLAAGLAPKLGQPHPTRDFTFVEDATRFLLLAGTKPGIGGVTLNLGFGEGHSVQEIAKLAIEISGVEVEPSFDSRTKRGGDTDILVVDNRLAVRTLDWKPSVSIREGLIRTWDAVRPRAEP